MNVFAFNTSKLYWSSKSYTDLLICLESQPSWSLGNEFIIFSPEKEMYYQIVGRNNQCSRADLHIPLLSYFPCDNTSTQSHLFITLQSFLECYYLNAPGIPANPVRHPQSVVQFINVYPNSLSLYFSVFLLYEYPSKDACSNTDSCLSYRRSYRISKILFLFLLHFLLNVCF